MTKMTNMTNLVRRAGGVRGVGDGPPDLAGCVQQQPAASQAKEAVRESHLHSKVLAGIKYKALQCMLVRLYLTSLPSLPARLPAEPF